MESKSKEVINVFWFKRDLRLYDSPALSAALDNPHPILLLYIFEPSLFLDDHYSQRHLNFIIESILDLNKELANYKAEIVCFQEEAISIFNQLSTTYQINKIFSTVETGIDLTYKRDLKVKSFCREEKVIWQEYPQNGVTRGRTNRDLWREELNDFLKKSIVPIDLNQLKAISKASIMQSKMTSKPFEPKLQTHSFQKGGRTEGLRWMQSFFEERVKHYGSYISQPELSRKGCSRLSPYFAWGNLSTREVYQKGLRLARNSPYKKQLEAFLSRLKWQSHFIQKFESEPRMEFEAVNRAFLHLNQPIREDYIERWKSGNTGYPLVDASMRAVEKTGYLNFRMRSLVVSFLTHHLFQPFTTGAKWLAQKFLDFEPGIHYSQMQMQAGLTGINVVRVYNPVTNALKYDSDAVFIKKYVPELSSLPIPFVHEPWKMTPMECMMYEFEYGVDYPLRIVDIKETRKKALETLYGLRKSESCQLEMRRILDQHTLHSSGSRFP